MVSELFLRAAVKLKVNRFTIFTLDYRLSRERERVLKGSRVIEPSGINSTKWEFACGALMNASLRQSRKRSTQKPAGKVPGRV